MESPEDKMACPHCGQEHGEEVFDTKEELVEHVASKFTTHIFQDFWKSRKEDFKNLSKREMAEEVFFEAIAEFLHNSLSDEPPQEEELK